MYKRQPQTVAEHALALLLTISRNIIESVERTKHGEYDYMGLKGIDLSGKTIGIIGTGKIGSLVARMAYGLNMKILASDEHQNPELAEKWGLKYVDMPELFKNSDVISLHVPMCPKNKYLLDEEQFKQIKRGAILINTARGGLINPEALIKALDDGTIYRAGIDVLEDEGLLKEERELFSPYFKIKDYQLALADHVLMKHPSVIVTPHNAFNSVESHKNILRTTVANIEGMLEGEPINVVND